MTRYVAVQRRMWLSDTAVPEDRPTCQVTESDALRDTGIVNAQGVSIFRLEERGPLGFVKTEPKS